MEDRICIVGLGYVGLPLAIEFAKKYPVVGFDISTKRIEELKSGLDRTLEISSEDLKQTKAQFVYQTEEIKNCNIFIITVPTPINESKQPDLKPLLSASKTVGSILKKNDLVIYESTVYPGCTEEDCVPVLENASGLKFNKDFFCGYSPERINPGDKTKTVAQIVKITSGSTELIATKVNDIYSSIITAGTHKASSIKVAEAAKVIENSQRDINIAFVNELALIFNRMGLDTNEVLAAAGTKWNFLPFKPGLVGGHCIGVDPYYLTHKAEALGYHPQVILSGRKINDGMGAYVANQLIKMMIKKGHAIKNTKILILGLTFKENCPDIRNTRVVDIISELKEFGCSVDVHDPWAINDEVFHEYGFNLTDKNCLTQLDKYQGIVIAVAHNQFRNLQVSHIDKQQLVIFDLKAILPKNQSDARL